MLTIERILCPTDFSEVSEKAYEYAYSLALHYGAKLYLHHTIEVLAQGYPFPEGVYTDLTKNAEERLDEMAAKALQKGVQTEVSARAGFASDSILGLAEDQHADLIVMGTHGRRALDRLVMGSITAHVLRRASCPVLAVRKPGHNFVHPEKSQDPVSLRKILFCTDFSKAANVALRYALSLAQEYNAELFLLHVLEGTPEPKIGQAIEEARQKLESLVPGDAHNWCTIKPLVRRDGKPYEEIIHVAIEQQIDLAVMGVRGRGAIDLAVFGSTTNRMLQLGPCPVLVVREETPSKKT